MSLAANLAPSWKLEHPIDEEQKVVQWILQGKAQGIASKYQFLMDWLTPLYTTKVLAVVADRPATEQKILIVEKGSLAIVVDRLVA